ncbi:MAG: hypothetical protein LC776_20105 [Acidobacteria bacterium]|nr:hypothetical protein [Acidobacteriota bacterium]
MNSFKDIEGKRVGTQRGTDLETIYKALPSSCINFHADRQERA